MTTSHHPVITSTAGLVLATGALLFAVLLWQHRLPVTLSGPSTSLNQPVERTTIPSQLSFSFEDLVDYFSDALERAPGERYADYARFESGSLREGYFNIVLERHGPQMLARFSVIDDCGMNVIREFFEAPFFQRSESERLYTLLYAGDGIHSANLPRFDVLIDYETRPEATIVTLFFSTPVRLTSEAHR